MAFKPLTLTSHTRFPSMHAQQQQYLPVASTLNGWWRWCLQVIWIKWNEFQSVQLLCAIIDVSIIHNSISDVLSCNLNELSHSSIRPSIYCIDDGNERSEEIVITPIHAYMFMYCMNKHMHTSTLYDLERKEDNNEQQRHCRTLMWFIG